MRKVNRSFDSLNMPVSCELLKETGQESYPPRPFALMIESRGRVNNVVWRDALKEAVSAGAEWLCMIGEAAFSHENDWAIFQTEQEIGKDQDNPFVMSVTANTLDEAIEMLVIAPARSSNKLTHCLILVDDENRYKKLVNQPKKG